MKDRLGCIVEMIVVKAEGDTGMKESQGFLPFGASGLQLLLDWQEATEQMRAGAASLFAYSPQSPTSLALTG